MIAAVSLIVSARPYGDGFPTTLRPVQYTVAPASPSARAMPRPAPRVAPATSATLPLRGFEVFLAIHLSDEDVRAAQFMQLCRRRAHEAHRYCIDRRRRPGARVRRIKLHYTRKRRRYGTVEGGRRQTTQLPDRADRGRGGARRRNRDGRRR